MILRFDPRNVDVTKCVEDDENDVHEHHCIHDWRIYWGNVERVEQ